MNNSKYEQYGFIKDAGEFEQIFGLSKLSEVHIDIYSNVPYMLLLRTSEKNVVSDKSNKRVILSKNDKKKTIIMNLTNDSINDVMVKKYSDSMYEFIFTINNNNNCKITVII